MARVCVSSGYGATERSAAPELDVEREAIDAWGAATRALAGHAPQALEVLATLPAHAGPALPVALTCAHVAATSAVQLDLALARRLAPVLDSLAGWADSGEELVEAARLAAVGWIGWLRGETLDDGALARAEKAARGAELATLLVQLGALRALLLETSGDVKGMLAAARRVSRMASADGLARAECLAHLVLARARRATHQPHLAIRILTALAEVAPPELTGWLALETRLAGELGAGLLPLAPSPATALAQGLESVLEQARRGDRDAFGAETAALLGSAAELPGFARELEQLVAALDAARPLPRALEAWAQGQDVLAPPAVHALGVRAIDETDDVGEAAIVAGPAREGRRVLGLGVPLALAGPSKPRLQPRSRMRQGRVETLLAVLASAGPGGLEEATVFARTYEMPYQAAVHRGVFDVLLTRARTAAEGYGELERRAGRLALVLSQEVVLPDPRASVRAHDRLLRALARSGRASADEVARQTGISVRAAQDALKSLSEDGVCVADRRGRQLVYAVEDTTFSEATEMLARRRRAHSEPP